MGEIRDEGEERGVEVGGRQEAEAGNAGRQLSGEMV